jgi:hypothetical protein|eukprot:SAG25_NODE_1110_length_3937_cov_1.792079_4_plen_74_part_00
MNMSYEHRTSLPVGPSAVAVDSVSDKLLGVNAMWAYMYAAERKITASQRTDFHPGERVDFRLEAADCEEGCCI